MDCSDLGGGRADVGSTAADGEGDEPFDTIEAARHLGCSASHLKKLRVDGGGPVYSRLFVRKGIIYQRRDLDAWRKARRYGSTTEYPEGLG